MPLVSVVIPTHNRPDLLVEAIASVHAQKFDDYEIIVVSNGEGNDRRSQKVAQTRGCKYLRLVEGNRSAARNAGIVAAQGDWIALLDHDDIWCLPQKLTHQLSFARENDVDVVFADFTQRSIDGQEHRCRVRAPSQRTIAEGMMFWNFAFGGASCGLFRREALLQLGGFDEKMPCAEDWDMWRRLAWSYRVGYLGEITTVIRRHKGAHGNTFNRYWHCAKWDVIHKYKAIRECPPSLRHMIPRTVVAMLSRIMLLLPYVWLNEASGGKVYRLRLRLRPRTRLRNLLRSL